MNLPVHFGAVLDQVAVSMRGPETLVSGEVPLPVARVLLANLAAAVAQAEEWRPPRSLADMVG